MISKKKSIIHNILPFIVSAVLIWSAIKREGYLIWLLEVLPGVIAYNCHC
jgi:putative membrane protein